MIVGNEDSITAAVMNGPQVNQASMKVLIGPDQGWEDHVMRIVELGPEGHSPKHAHDWPHINYILEGEGHVEIDGTGHTLTAGAYAYVPAGRIHQFRNTGQGRFRFICIVPKRGHQ